MSDDEPDVGAGPVQREMGMPSRRVTVSAVRPIGFGASGVRFVLLALAAPVALTTVAGCSPESPVSLNQTRPAVTVTVTTTVTPPPTSAPATSTSTSSSNPGARLTSSPAPAGGTASGLPSGSNPPQTGPAGGPPSAGLPGGATQTKLVAQYQGLIAQVMVVDALPRIGAKTGSALDDLAARYRALRAAPVPAKVDQPSYVGRLFSLELFATAAAGEARSSSPQAAARYAVIRAQTATLLALVNSGLGTALTLPVPGASPPSTPATTATTATSPAPR